MHIKSYLKPRKIFFFFVFIAILVLGATISLASSGFFHAPLGTMDRSYSPDQYRFIVKLKPDMLAKAESSLNQTDLEIKSDSPQNMQPMFRKYKIKRMAPVYKNLIRWKKKTGKSEKEYIKQIKQRFSHRTKRYHGTADSPEVSSTYVIEANINSKQEFETMLKSLKRDPSFEYVEPDRIMTIQTVPNDPYFSSRSSWGQSFDDLYGIKKIKSPEAWDLSTGSGVTVAVVDTGIDKNHPEIAANIWINSDEIPNNGVDDDNNGYIDDISGWNYINNSNNSVDDYGHGTHVAGTIAAVGNNGTGVIGVAPNAKIMDLKAFSQRTGSTVGIVAAIRYAADNGADIINCSFGGPGDSQSLREAIEHAYDLGVVIVAAAGNEKSEITDFYPGCYHNVITVSAIDNDNNLADFSNFGAEVDVAAPGVDILSLRATGTTMGTPLNDYYTVASGTSMSTPHVSGLAALIISGHPEFSNEQTRQVICTSADDIFTPGIDKKSGFGCANALKAVNTSFSLEAHMNVVASGNVVTGSIPITGTAKGTGFLSYRLEYGAGSTPNTWILISQGSSPIEKSQLGVFNSTIIPDGIYTLRLTVRDNSSPQKIYTDHLEVNVDNISISNPESPSVPSIAKVFKPGKVISINGTVQGPTFQRFHLEWGEGLNPIQWFSTGFTLVNSGYSQITNGLLANWDSSVFPGRAGYYQIRLVVDNADFINEAQTLFYLEPDLLSGNWPQLLNTNPNEHNSVSLAKDGNGMNNLVIALPHIIGFDTARFNRYSIDGTTIFSTSYQEGFYRQVAVGNLDGLPGDETVFVKNGHICIMKPDNTCIEIPSSYGPDFYKDSQIILQDINGDSNLEILAMGRNIPNKTRYLAVWNSQGVPLTSNFPIQITDYAGDPYTRVYFSVVDLNNDGKKEIIIQENDSSFTSTLKLFNWDGTPLNWGGMQPVFPSSLIQNMAIGDLNHDGQVEIVLTVGKVVTAPPPYYFNRVSENKVYVLTPDGNIKPGWPINVPHFETDIGIADMDRDGNAEIIISSWNYVSILKIDGTPFSKIWPLMGIPNNMIYKKFSIGDINSDGFPEIVITREKIALKSSDYAECELVALDLNGNIITSWKLLGMDGELPANPVDPFIGDFDNNGKVDIAVDYSLISKSDELLRGVITVLSLNADYHADSMDWPMTFHDPQNTSVNLTQPIAFTVTALNLDKNSYVLKTGLTQKVTVTATYAHGTVMDVSNLATYQVADSSIASIDETGAIKGLKSGTTSMTVTYGGKSVNAQITVGASVSSINVNAYGYNIPLGLTANVVTMATYSDGTITDVTNEASYQINDSGIATIDNTGKIMGISVGSAILTVSYEGQSAYAWVSVAPIPDSIGFALAPYTITVGTTKKVMVMGDNSGVSRDFTYATSFQISDPQIASINSSGEICGLRPGAVTLTGKLGDITCMTQINVIEPVLSKISLDSANYNVIKGTNRNIIVTATYSNNNTANVTGSAEYQIADTSIATVDINGNITGRTVGNTTLTVSYQGETTTAQVSVLEPVVTGVNLNKTVVSLTVGQSEQLVATIIPENAANKNITWSILNQSTDNVITVAQDGMITANNPGTAVIRVASQTDLSKYAECTVTVLPIPVTGVNLNKTAVSLTIGQSEQLVATIIPANATNKSILWSVFSQSTDNIVTVAQDGMITANNPGTTVIRATSQADSSKYADCVVTVTSPSQGVSLNEGFESINGTVPNGWAVQEVHYVTSSSHGEWSFDSNGTRPQVSPFSGSRLAAFNSYFAQSGVSARLFQLSGVNPGNKNVCLDFWMYHDTGYPNCSDNIQVQVSVDGGLNWVNVGEPIIRYSTVSGWTKHTLSLDQYKNASDLRIAFLAESKYGNNMFIDEVSLSTPLEINLNKTTLSLTAGQSEQLVATVSPANTTNKNITWSVYSQSADTVVTVAQDGIITANNFGTAVIRATSQADSSKYAECTVTVTPLVPGILVSEGFELCNENAPNGWAIQEVNYVASSLHGIWSFDSSGERPQVNPFSGFKLAAFNSYSAQPGVSTRLFQSSGVNPGNKSVYLDFWMYHDTGYSNYSDNIQVQVSVDGGLNWVNVGNPITRYNAVSGWTKHTISLDQYKSASDLRIAFLAESKCGNNMFIDEISITTLQ